MVVAWVLLPLLLGLLALGCGLLLERAADARLPGALLAPAGLAVVVLAAQFAVLTDATAELATPLVIVLALAGLVLGRERLVVAWREQRAPATWALGVALAVFTVFALPVVLSGSATFAGYIKLDDTGSWLGLTDRVIERGRNLDGLIPSSYEKSLFIYLGQGYPLGSFLPLSIASVLLPENTAWLFQPYLAFLAAMLALTLYALAAPIVESRALRAVIAFTAAQSAILFGYSLWGGVKELAGAWLLALVAALVVPLFREGPKPRLMLLPAVACAATFATLSLASGVWLVPALYAVVVVLIMSSGSSDWLRAGVAFAGLTLVLSIPPILAAEDFISIGRHVLTSESEIGNLVNGPLSGVQVLGIWPAGDFRRDPSNEGVTYLMLVLLAIGILAGIAYAWTRRSWGPPLYFACTAVGVLVLTRIGSPWADGKAITMASPAFLFLGLLGAAALYQRVHRIAGVALVAVLAGGVLWSNVLAYSEVNLAPRDRLSELEEVEERIAGEGPTLITSYEVYATRHFLADGDPEGASDLRRRRILLRNGQQVAKLQTADIDQFQLAVVLKYRTLVLRRSPSASRPPSVYELTWQGRFYEIWQRKAGPPPNTIRTHLPLGDEVSPLGIPRCRDVLGLARVAGRNGTLVTVRRPAPAVAALSQTADPNVAEGLVSVPETGPYEIWIGGGFRRELEVLVDGASVEAQRHKLSHGEYLPMGTVELSQGTHEVTLRVDDPGIRPGTRGESYPLGPLVFSRGTAASPLTRVQPSRARSLCRERLDWVEAVGG